jgi:hypothetical protein
MFPRYYRLMKLHVMLNDLLPRAVVINPYTAVIERVGKNYDPRLKQLFYYLVSGLARLHKIEPGDGRARGYVQVSREDIMAALSLMKDLLKPPPPRSLGEGAVSTWCFLADYPQGLSVRELELKSGVPLNTLKRHLLDLHAQGYITREKRRSRSGQHQYINTAVVQSQAGRRAG